MEPFTADRRHLQCVAALLAALGLLGVVPQRSYACASCGCTLSADAAMGYSAQPGWRLSVEYDYIDQSQLRSGTRAVSGVAPGEELEHETAVAGLFHPGPVPSEHSVRQPQLIRDIVAAAEGAAE